MFILESIISTVAPHSCLGCGAEGPVICQACARTSLAPLPSRCYRCQRLTEDFTVCKGCRYRSPLKHVWACVDYETTIKRLIHSFKFARAQAAAEAIARLLADSLPYLPKDTLVVPVPTATSRQRQRGYDHAALLAKFLAAQLGLPYFSNLRRQGQSRQVGADKATREHQLLSAFYLSHAHKVVNASILLVDDIVTTGASLEAAARVLKSAGARHIDAVVLAQKQ